MRKTRITLSYLAAVFLATACTEDELPARPAATGPELLMEKNWRLTSDVRTLTTTDNTTSPPDELYDRAYPCDKDDFWQFAAANKLTIDQGATLCDPDSPQMAVGTWNLSADEKTLRVVTSARTVTHEVLSLTPSTLQVKSSYTTPEDIVVTNIQTFSSF